jgi:predicted metalloprotease with PDZ domain
VSLLAHEYFHAWNVKRLRPAALGPFDYEQEAYTTDLWVAEGVTSYYDRITPIRAGLRDDSDDYFKAIAERFRNIAERPGASRRSLTESSWDAWIKAYRPDSNSVNSTISYYEKGELVALMLDLRIRRLSDGKRSLDDVLRLAWERFAARDVGYYDGAMADLSAEILGAELGTFFADYVDGTATLDPNPDLAFVGLSLVQVPKDTDRALEKDEFGFALAPSLGVGTESSRGLCRIKEVREGGAAWQAGLDAGDIVLAIDGMRVTADTIQDRLDRTAGRPVTITYYRGQELRSMEVEPVMARVEEWKILPLDDVDSLQEEAFEAWMKLPFPHGD